MGHKLGYFTGALLLLSLLAQGQSFKDDPPRYNYDTLPQTSFTCQGKPAGRYYADTETDCQLFHVCVKMNVKELQDFKFLCPNGTTFDQEHQVCMDYYQVVCHDDIGTNPLGHIFELMKLSAGRKDYDLTSGKFSYVDPDVAERNTLGDDFQVDEYNNNKLATSQNSLNFISNKPRRKPSNDIFYQYSAKPTAKYTTTTTTAAPTTRPTTTTTTTDASNFRYRSSVPTTRPVGPAVTARKPNLETFESYETESIHGFSPQNQYNFRNPQDFEYSSEIRDQETSSSPSTTTTTTKRPPVFHNTFRTSVPDDSLASVAPPQTYQQQATRFNDDFFRKIPSSTETSVSKAAQFYVNSNTRGYSTPEVRKPSTNPFFQTTTAIPFSPRVSSTQRSLSNSGSGFQYEIVNATNDQPPRRTPTAATTTTEVTPKPFFSARLINHSRGLSNRGSLGNDYFISSSTTNAPKQLDDNSRQSKFFLPSQSDESDRPKSFSAKIINNFPTEGTIRPRSFSGVSNSNQVGKSNANRNSFGFSTVTILPPTTAEPYIPPSTTFDSYYQNEATSPSEGSTYYQRITTAKPDKYSIFFSKASTYSNKANYYEKETAGTNSDASTPAYTEGTTYRPFPTAKSPSAAFEFQKTAISGAPRLSNFERNYLLSSTAYAPEPTIATTTTVQPSRRGVRRRINRPRQQQQPKRFDPEFTYSRKTNSSLVQEKIEKESFSKNDEEIFTAQASVFQGNPKANLFYEEKKEVTKAETKVEEAKKLEEDAPKLVENYGRRIRPNRREQININNNQRPHLVPQATGNLTEIPQEQQRKLIKRLKLKSTTPFPDIDASSSSTVFHSKIYRTPTTTTTTERITTTPLSATTLTYEESQGITGSTRRPVKRISVKTRVGHRKPENYTATALAAAIEADQLKNAFGLKEKLYKISTTEEPELVTASADEVAKKKLTKKFSTVVFTKEITPTTTSTPFYGAKELHKNSTAVIVKVSRKSQQHPFPTPISIKQPILTQFDRKETSSVSVQTTVEEGPTRSPDYDYTYYNTDTDDEYSAALKLDNKNYGKKPNKNKAL